MSCRERENLARKIVGTVVVVSIIVTFSCLIGALDKDSFPMYTWDNFVFGIKVVAITASILASLITFTAWLIGDLSICKEK